MAVSFHQAKYSVSTTGATLAEFTSVEAGDCILVFFALQEEARSVSSCSDDENGAYSLIIGPVNSGTSTQLRLYVYAKYNVQAGSPAVTFAYDSAVAAMMIAAVYRGAATTGAVEDYGTNDQEDATAPAASEVTLSSPGMILEFTAASQNRNPGGPTGYTKRTPISNAPAHLFDKSETAAGNYTPPAWATPQTAFDVLVATLALKEATAASTSVPQRLALLGTG